MFVDEQSLKTLGFLFLYLCVLSVFFQSRGLKQDYPYTAEGDDCKKKTCDTVPGTMVDKWIDVDHNSADVRFVVVAGFPAFVFDHRRCVFVVCSHVHIVWPKYHTV